VMYDSLKQNVLSGSSSTPLTRTACLPPSRTTVPRFLRLGIMIVSCAEPPDEASSRMGTGLKFKSKTSQTPVDPSEDFVASCMVDSCEASGVVLTRQKVPCPPVLVSTLPGCCEPHLGAELTWGIT
jgi:hypothetical protein